MRLSHLFLALVMLLPAHRLAAQDSDAIDRAVTENPYRTADQKARDAYRHPAETLKFFGITADMTVAEPLPGWYTEILGDLLRDKGTYIALNTAPHLSQNAGSRARSHVWRDNYIASKGKLFGDKAFARFMLTEDGFAADDSVDAILAFRSMHGWVYSDVLEEVLAEFFRVMKPGGVLGVVQHRENEDSPNTPADRRGYLKQSFVIEAVTKAGFVLADQSEINANPKDTKDYEIGVWGLPPVLRAGSDEERRKNQAIGESDRMTLKFVKPGQ
ncbi:methyltransferase [Iodidimonas muriae]|uniref:Methyltransferase n=1 Tax=Iodidimonas muriae TaxID=261467 RepID=A0ABQ2L8I8_9PROT|nr:methyltransferase domain-containing protein [Iodidimonas muriae]GER05771.1 methyltransferase [Kordiimonadales bacterium JCM 17843]GGO06827.1 methyltransferase [Iodidimonas muriae]